MHNSITLFSDNRVICLYTKFMVPQDRYGKSHQMWRLSPYNNALILPLQISVKKIAECFVLTILLLKIQTK